MQIPIMHLKSICSTNHYKSDQSVVYQYQDQLQAELIIQYVFFLCSPQIQRSDYMHCAEMQCILVHIDIK